VECNPNWHLGERHRLQRPALWGSHPFEVSVLSFHPMLMGRAPQKTHLDILLHYAYNIMMRATLQLFLVLSATTGSHAFVHPRVSSFVSSKLDVVITSTRTTDDWVQQGIEEASPQKSKEGCVVGPSRVLIYDTTLRDGTQGESVSASCGRF
jgi:hypothetical protein